MVILFPQIHSFLVILSWLVNKDVNSTQVRHRAVILKFLADGIANSGGRDIEDIERADFWCLRDGWFSACVRRRLALHIPHGTSHDRVSVHDCELLSCLLTFLPTSQDGKVLSTSRWWVNGLGRLFPYIATSCQHYLIAVALAQFQRAHTSWSSIFFIILTSPAHCNGSWGRCSIYVKSTSLRVNIYWPGKYKAKRGGGRNFRCAFLNLLLEFLSFSSLPWLQS